MRLCAFIAANRAQIDEAIKRVCPNCNVSNDAEREQWVLNDEGLYAWARSEGCQI